jgi:hypothetical protein
MAATQPHTLPEGPPSSQTLRAGTVHEPFRFTPDREAELRREAEADYRWACRTFGWIPPDVFDDGYREMERWYAEQPFAIAGLSIHRMAGSA